MPRRVLLLSTIVFFLVVGFALSSSSWLAQPRPDVPQAGAVQPVSGDTVATRLNGPEDPLRLLPRAPRADEQDPDRRPDLEPPPPVWKRTPGGVTHVQVPASLDGDYVVHPGEEEAPQGQTTFTLRIEVEEGLGVTPKEFSSFIMETLNHPKSWAKDGEFTFGRSESNPDLRVILASPATVDEECAPLETNSQWSCGIEGKAMINAERWINGAPAFLDAGGDMLEYRRYLINHEVGHLIGNGHDSCPEKGKLAPVMVQQSISVQECKPNGWVHP